MTIAAPIELNAPPRSAVRIAPNARTVLAICAIAAIAAAAIALRLELLVRSNWLLEGDDALSTLMALGVLDGDRPIMLKNQTYAAAWEPYAIALSYTAFGISRISAKLPALLGSLALIGTTWLLARVTVGRTAAWFAAAMMAIPPAYDLVLWLKPWAPYTEVILLGSLTLSCAIAIERRLTSDAWLAAACGIAGGLALWMHPLAVWYLAAALVTLLVTVRGRHRWARVLTFGLLGFGIGGVPIWLFNLHTGGVTFHFILNGTQGQTADRLAVLQAWWNNDLPRGAGLWHPWGPSPVWLGVVMAPLLCLAVLSALFVRKTPAWRPLDAVIVFLLLIPTMLVLSGFGGPALNPYGFDATGRYAPPIWSGVAVLIGGFCAVLWRVRRALSITVCGVALAANAISIMSVDPLVAFQSPYWDKLPASNDALLATLAADDVHYVWLNHWAGQPLMLDARAAHQTLYAYDWYDVQAGGIDRFPEYLPLIESADRPAFVLVTDEQEPALERAFRRMGISFVERRSPPYVVVIPLSRKVHPSEVTSALDYRY